MENFREFFWRTPGPRMAKSFGNTGASGGAKNPRVVNFIDCTGGTLPVKSRRNRNPKMT
jgi:hypothetical protein